MMMEIYMKENGLMICLMEKVVIITMMEQSMKGNGKMIYQMEMEKNDAESVLTALIWRCGILASLIKGRALGGMNEKTENFEHLTRLVLLLTTDENSRYRVPEKTVFEKTQVYFASAAEGDEE